MLDQKLTEVVNQLEQYHNSERFHQIEILHANAFSWKRQDRIPLGIHVVNPEYTQGLTYRNEWLKPEVFFDIQTRQLADTLEVGSDLLPVIGINHLGHSIITSLFGAKQFIPESHTALLNDTGPTPLAVFSDIAEAIKIENLSFDKGLMPNLENFAQYYRTHLPEWVNLVGPMPAGPFTVAMELRGSEILIDLVDNPVLSLKLINLCAKATFEIEKRFRRLVRANVNKNYTNFGILGAGLRLGDDCICNISKEMIKQFCTSDYAEVNKSFGGKGHVHFCSLPHSRFEHIYQAFLNMHEVTVVSSQFGFEYYQQRLEQLRGRLAIESFYGDAYKYAIERYGSFENWANQFVPRFKNESGLVLYMSVSSVDEGKHVWEVWQKAHLSQR